MVACQRTDISTEFSLTANKIALIIAWLLRFVKFDELNDEHAKKEIEHLTSGYEDKKLFFIDRLAQGVAKIAAAVIFCGLALFEFWNYPPFKIIDISDIPSAYAWLKNEPGDFVIAEYPLDINSPNEMYKFYQTKHEKKMIDGTIPGSYANKTEKDMLRLSGANTVARLSKMQVKYALVHKADYLNNGLVDEVEELEKIAHNPGLKFLKTFDDIDVYAVR